MTGGGTPAVGEDDTKFNVDLYERDRPFLNTEGFRMLQEHLEATGELERPSRAEVVSKLLKELRELRAKAEACTCGACETGDASEPDVELV